MQQQQPWYQQTGGIVLFLVLFFPVGLYLMWRHGTWSARWKWAITAVAAVMLAAGAAQSGQKPAHTAAAAPTSTPTPIATLVAPTATMPARPKPTVVSPKVAAYAAGAYVVTMRLRIGANLIHQSGIDYKAARMSAVNTDVSRALGTFRGALHQALGLSPPAGFGQINASLDSAATDLVNAAQSEQEGLANNDANQIGDASRLVVQGTQQMQRVIRLLGQMGY